MAHALRTAAAYPLLLMPSLPAAASSASNRKIKAAAEVKFEAAEIEASSRSKEKKNKKREAMELPPPTASSSDNERSCCWGLCCSGGLVFGSSSSSDEETFGSHEEKLHQQQPKLHSAGKRHSRKTAPEMTDDVYKDSEVPQPISKEAAFSDKGKAKA